MKGILIKVDGTVVDFVPANKTDYKLDELQKAVDGLIDIVNIPDSELIFVVNDEGAFTKQPNVVASLMCSIMFGAQCCLWGDVILCHTSMVK